MLHFALLETIIRRLSAENEIKTYLDFQFFRSRLKFSDLLLRSGKSENSKRERKN